ncbi:phosphorylase family protein [Clostridiales bacterium oral taxon 876 str. F0540]|nr:phosphorylase family protein [Clostridiales bacterium oral taxon 876 str. F0540]
MILIKEGLVLNSLFKIAIICPCKIEYDKCKLILNLLNETSFNGRTVCFKKYNSYEIAAIFAGPGKIQCASATQLIIDRFNPDLVIDVGGSGSLSNDFKYNDIIIAKEIYEFDICELEDFNKSKDELTSKTIFNDISDESIKCLKMTMKEIESLVNVKIKLGNIASGEKTIKDSEIREKMCSLLKAHACNWETASIIKTANLNKVSGISIRVITDNADEKMEKDFYNNWGTALEKLFLILNTIFEKSNVSRLLNL